ncbi:ATPases of the AAA+ class [uncultured Candidatus Thioglobus sp.]|nr:ATPases of the AAA+ class [uncultured Candidatus Thioglobus sp.]
MKLNSQQFQAWDQKIVTLLGMSGIGKTRVASILRRDHWFHYSNDYRIGTYYLDEPILDNIKEQMIQIPCLHDLLRSDSLHVQNNITIDNLVPVANFLGKLGDPEAGGLSLEEFKYRQKLHCQAEIATMKDLPKFIYKAHNIYGYDHVINDSGGSLCELEEEEVLNILHEHSVILYIQASQDDEQQLIENAIASPKPLYYRELFLDAQLASYMKEKDIAYIALIQPDDFVRWLFPRLFHSRVPKYEEIAKKYGYTVTTQEIKKVKNTDDFIQLVMHALDRE